jgi:hypothetical protein
MVKEIPLFNMNRYKAMLMLQKGLPFNSFIIVLLFKFVKQL